MNVGLSELDECEYAWDAWSPSGNARVKFWSGGHFAEQDPLLGIVLLFASELRVQGDAPIIVSSDVPRY